jgi:hypothetical protein
MITAIFFISLSSNLRVVMRETANDNQADKSHCYCQASHIANPPDAIDSKPMSVQINRFFV